MSNRLVHKPSFREKKRYLRYGVVAGKKISREQSEDAIKETCLGFLGELTYGMAGIKFMSGPWRENKGIIKVNRKYVKHLQACLAITKLGSCSFRTEKVSGIIAKVKEE